MSKRGRKFLRGSIWWVQYWFNGRDHRESTHSTNEAVANKLLTKRLAAKDAGTLQESALKPLKFEDLRSLIELNYKLKENRSGDRLQNAMTALAETFAGWRTGAITDKELTKYFTARVESGKARATALYEVRCLRRAFKLAKLPVPFFECGTLDNARKGFFEDEPFQAVLGQLRPYLRPVMRVARITSWRTQSELLPLLWSAVDWKQGTMKLAAGMSKTKEPRTFPFGVHPELLAILKAQRDLADRLQRERGIVIPWVFFRVTTKTVEPIKSYTTAWNNARQRAGYPELLVHDLRRTGVRRLRQAGVPESVAMSLSGHKTRSVFDRYDIVDGKDQKVGVEQLAKFHAPVDYGTIYGTVTPLPVKVGGMANA